MVDRSFRLGDHGRYPAKTETMNLSLSQMDWVIKHCGYTQIAGFALAAAFFGLLLPCIFTGLACYWLGLLGAGFASWRIERGLLDAEHRVSFSDDGCICVVSDSSYHAHSLAWGAREFALA